MLTHDYTSYFSARMLSLRFVDFAIYTKASPYVFAADPCILMTQSFSFFGISGTVIVKGYLRTSICSENLI